jgi:hypothetical protein
MYMCVRDIDFVSFYHVSEITFIRYAQDRETDKPNHLKVFGSNNIKSQVSHNNAYKRRLERLHSVKEPLSSAEFTIVIRCALSTEPRTLKIERLISQII